MSGIHHIKNKKIQCTWQHHTIPQISTFFLNNFLSKLYNFAQLQTNAEWSDSTISVTNGIAQLLPAWCSLSPLTTKYLQWEPGQPKFSNIYILHHVWELNCRNIANFQNIVWALATVLHCRQRLLSFHCQCRNTAPETKEVPWPVRKIVTPD